MKPYLLRGLVVLCAHLWLFSAPALSQGEPESSVVIDDTLPGTSLEALAGPDYQLSVEQHGHQVGSNALFSLWRLGLLSDESLTVSGPDSIRTAVMRVTGPESSSIDGTLRSTIEGASLFLINPNGVLFGESARLDVKGAFYATTSDYVAFEDGAEFHARFPDRDTPFSTMPVSAFGFLSEDPAGISLLGSELSTATVEISGGIADEASGYPLGLIGGDIDIAGAESGPSVLYTAGARIDLASLNSPGTVTIVEADAVNGIEPDLVVDADGALGEISLVDGVVVATGGPPPGRPSTFVNGSGDVFIRAHNLTLREAEVRAITTTQRAAGRIDVVLDGDFVADTGGRSESTGLFAGTGLIAGDPEGPGVRANNDVRTFLPEGNARIRQVVDEAGSVVWVEHIAQGPGGPIRVDARNVTLLRGAKLSSSGVFGGNGGDIEVKASDSVVLSGVDSDGESGGIFANAQLSGDAGSITIAAPELVVEEQAGVFTEVRGGDGIGGSIEVNVDRLRIASSGRIDTSNRGSGSGGRIEVDAVESIELEGSRSEIATIAHEEATGSAGSLLVVAPSIRLNDGAAITTESRGEGDAGTVDVRGDRIELVRSKISASSVGGAGGDIYVNGGPLVRTADGSLSIDKPIGVGPGELLSLDRSEISTSVQGGDGGGGDIAIDPTFVILKNSRVIAQAVEGPGGNIRIVADNFISDISSIVDASSQFAADGDVEIISPARDLRGDLSKLPSEIVDVVSLLRERCAARQNGAASASFVLAGREGVPAAPDGFLPAFHRFENLAGGDVAADDIESEAGDMDFALSIGEEPESIRVRCRVKAG